MDGSNGGETRGEGKGNRWFRGACLKLQASQYCIVKGGGHGAKEAACHVACRTLKKSKKLDTVDMRMEPDTLMVFASSLCSSPSSVSSSISALARHPLRGVRTWGMGMG